MAALYKSVEIQAITLRHGCPYRNTSVRGACTLRCASRVKGQDRPVTVRHGSNSKLSPPHIGHATQFDHAPQIKKALQQLCRLRLPAILCTCHG
ncbi:hypothetical protein CEXT_51421 [Caerostris extrusa]|uniref:Uncharacterized protein n=1 Tax=Caerostris extrusa TaxID=172846 RepID=A0AAV4N563_CAEEX|nr:hypothetical protein CEXT_51421 [Caerostris extrusa]